MSPLAFAFYYITPYVAVVAFLGGIVYRLYQWSHWPPAPAHLSLFPRPRGKAGRLLDALVDMFTLRGLFRVNKPLWISGFIMHLGLLFILVGHIRAFQDVTFLWNWLGWGEEQVHLFSGLAGTIAGTLFTLPLFYLLARRWSGAVKWLSAPEDYLLLFLLLGIALTGFHMRLLRLVDVHELNQFFRGLATFRWQAVPHSAGPAFIYHFALVQLLMLYFPFSKLMHTIGSIFAKMVARS
ncbi:MAG: respiratory nitrate reductase subunit gamma [Anaerolineae bacterium]